MKVILYSDDINLLSHWEGALVDDYLIIDDLAELYKLSSSIIVLNYSACMPSCGMLLKKLNAAKNRILVLHRTPSFSTAKELLQFGAYGYGNALMREHFIVSAINTIQEGMVWLYPEYTSNLITELPLSEEPKEESLLEKLTLRERDVALLLKDALSYKEIGQKLDITPRTVKAHAHNTYVKLNVKDRLELALLLR